MKVVWILIFLYGWKFKELLVVLKVWKGVVCVYGYVYIYVDCLKRIGIWIWSIELIYMLWNFDYENLLWYVVVDLY